MTNEPQLWTPDDIVIPPHGMTIRKDGRPNYAKALGRRSLPSVTGILDKNDGWSKPGMMNWANKIGIEHAIHYRRFTDDAARTGTMAHEMVEKYLKGLPVPTFPKDDPEQVAMAQDGFENFLDWYKGRDFQMLVAEYPMSSKFLEVGGTIDTVGLDSGEITLLDLKTSNGVYESHRAQVAAYEFMWNERFPEYQIQKVWILQIHKTGGGFAHYQLSNWQRWQGLFNFCQWRILEVSRNAKGPDAKSEILKLTQRFNSLFGIDTDW